MRNWKDVFTIDVSGSGIQCILKWGIERGQIWSMLEGGFSCILKWGIESHVCIGLQSGRGCILKWGIESAPTQPGISLVRLGILKWGIEREGVSYPALKGGALYPKMRNWKWIILLTFSPLCILKWGIESILINVSESSSMGRYPKMRNWKD